MDLGQPRRRALQLAHRRLAGETIEHRQVGGARGHRDGERQARASAPSWALGLVAAERVERGVGLLFGRAARRRRRRRRRRAARVPGRQRCARRARRARPTARDDRAPAAMSSPAGVAAERPGERAEEDRVDAAAAPATRRARAIAPTRSCRDPLCRGERALRDRARRGCPRAARALLMMVAAARRPTPRIAGEGYYAERRRSSTRSPPVDHPSDVDDPVKNALRIDAPPTMRETYRRARGEVACAAKKYFWVSA